MFIPDCRFLSLSCRLLRFILRLYRKFYKFWCICLLNARLRRGRTLQSLYRRWRWRTLNSLWRRWRAIRWRRRRWKSTGCFSRWKWRWRSILSFRRRGRWRWRWHILSSHIRWRRRRRWCNIWRRRSSRGFKFWRRGRYRWACFRRRRLSYVGRN